MRVSRLAARASGIPPALRCPNSVVVRAGTLEAHVEAALVVQEHVGAVAVHVAVGEQHADGKCGLHVVRQGAERLVGVPSRLGDRLVGHTYQLVGVQSGKNLSATASGDSALSIADTPETLTDTKNQAWKFTQIDQSDTERPDLKAYVITNTDCKVLVAKDGTNAFSDESVEDAKSDPAARWILNTSDGATYRLLNASAKQNIDVDAFEPKAGAAASDEEDGDLTDKILVEGSVNTEKAGEYTLTYSVTDSEGASYTVKRVVTVREKSEPIELGKPTEPTELTKPIEPTKPGDTVKPNKPDAGNKQPGLSKTGASVSGVFGAFAALLAVGRSPIRWPADFFVDCRGLTREVKSTHPAKVPFECLRMGLSPEQVERNRDSWAGALPVGPVFVSRGMMVAW